MAGHFRADRFIVLSGDRGLIRTVKTSVADSGIDVVPVTTITAALDQVGLHSPAGTVVIADLDNAGLDGLDFIRVITAGGDATPVVVAYGPETEELAAQAVQIGAAGRYAKPLGPSEIRRALGTINGDDVADDGPRDDAAGHSGVDIRDLVDECGRALRMVSRRWQLQRGIDLSIEVSTESVTVRMPRPDLVHIVIALALNALEALYQTKNGAVSLRCGLAAGRAYVAVADNGPGMDDSQREHAFDPYFTSHGSRGALGLGLTNALDDVRAYGGSIILRSQLGSGTTAIIDLPAALAPLTARRQGVLHDSAWDALLRAVPSVER